MSSWTCGLACVTALSINIIDDWLEESCQGEWTVRLADFDGPLRSGAKKIEVLFEQREDMASFKAGFKSFEAQILQGGGGDGMPGH